MNVTLIIVAAVLILFIWTGYRKGLLRMLMSVIAAVAAIVLMWILLPYAKEFLLRKTPVYDRISSEITETIEEKLLPEEEQPEEGIRNLPLPGTVRDELLERYEQADGKVREKTEAVGAKLSEMAVTAMAASGTFLVIFVLVCLLILRRGRRRKAGALRKIDKLLGAALAAAEALILVGIFFLIVTALSFTPFGSTALKQIADSRFLSFLYDRNVLVMIVQAVASKVPAAR